MTTQSIYKSPAGEQIMMDLYNAVLADWSVPCQTLTIPTRHGDTFIIVSGDEAAPPLLLLHGAGSNSAIWRPDMMQYSQAHRVFAVDLLGEAGKSAPSRPLWDGPAYAEWLEDVFDALKIDKAAIVGISQGSWTALKFATCYPKRITKLALLCPGGVVPDRLSFVLRVIPLSLMGKWGTKQIMHLVFGNVPIPKEAEEFMTLSMTHFKPRLGVLPLFSDEELQHLTMPVLVIMGEKDALRDANKIVTRLQHLLPKFTAKVIPDAGHALLDTTRYVAPFL
ncbi:MAG: alpha/beta hydrolase [Chloroflexota bacterium]